MIALFRHVVMFHWIDGVDQAQIEEVAAALDQMRRRIDVIRDMSHGRDEGLVKDNFDYVVTVDFDSAEAYQTYAAHQAHTSLITTSLAPRIEGRAAVQYEVRASLDN